MHADVCRNTICFLRPVINQSRYLLLDRQEVLARMKEKSTILIVDDSELNRTVLADILGDEYNFIEAENGARAIELLRTHTDIDLILLDMVMPEMNGFDAVSYTHLDVYKRQEDIRRFLFRVGDKQEVCQRRQHGKAERPQRLCRAVAGGADLAAGLLEVILVADGCLTNGKCDRIHRVRVVRVFNRLERGNQRLRAERVADAHTRERARLAGCLHDEQVFVLAEQRNRALRAEVHIRLVDDDNAVLIVLQQVIEELERYAAAGRRVRVRQDDTEMCIRDSP